MMKSILAIAQRPNRDSPRDERPAEDTQIELKEKRNRIADPQVGRIGVLH